MTMRIGDVTLKNGLILAPMAGISDLPFRLLCTEMGAALTYTEMVSAKAVTYRNRGTEALLHTAPEEGPVSLQLFGSEPAVIAEAACMLKDRPFAFVDLNMGCPVPKVAGHGEGSALMRDPDLVEEIVHQTVKAAEKPVTVKIRKGFDEQHPNAVEVAKAAERGGAAAIAVHGRTRTQMYAGCADWEIIRRVKDAVCIPVIGNGDVKDPQSAMALQETTGCDGIMIGRAARGNPWIFRRILLWQETGEDPGEVGWPQRRDMILRHAGMQAEEKGEVIGMREMRSHVAWYTAGIPHSSALRREVNQVSTYQELEALLTKIFP